MDSNNGNALALREETSIEVYNPDQFVVPGMEQVQASELRIPRLQLVQAQSRMDGAADHLGQWYNNVTREFEPFPELLIIGLAKGRVMFPDKYAAENKPLCGSDDGRHPRADYIGNTLKSIVNDLDGPAVKSLVIPAECAACPFAKWGDNGEPPACNEVATIAGVTVDEMPVVFQVRSSGMRNVPALKTLIAANGIRRVIRLGAVQEKKDSGTFFVPVFTLGGKPSKTWQESAIRLARLGNLAARNQADMAAAGGDEAPRNGGGNDFGGEVDFPEELPF